MTLRFALSNLWTKFDFPTWVALRRLGDSNAVKATALAPVLAGLILLNDEVARLFHSSIVDVQINSAPAWLLGFVPLPRLHMIYLGLSLMGVGALTFGLCCPDEIRRYPSAETWLAGEDRMLTGGRLKSEFYKILATYSENTEPVEYDRHDDQRRGDRAPKNSYATERYSQIHELVAEIVELAESAETGSSSGPGVGQHPILAPDGSPIESDFSPEESSWYFPRQGTGQYIDTDAYLDVMSQAITAERGLWEELVQIAVQSFKERIVYIRFQDLAYSRRSARGFTTLIYGLGIAALAIPTLHTFVMILAKAAR